MLTHEFLGQMLGVPQPLRYLDTKSHSTSALAILYSLRAHSYASSFA